MTFESQVSKKIECVFNGLFAPPAIESFARSGSYLLRLCFAHKSLSDQFLPSFLQSEAGQADLQVGFLTSREADLSSLIPQPPTKHHTLADDHCFAVWQPGDRPLLYLFDRRTNRALMWLASGAAPDWIASRPNLPIMYAFSRDTPWMVAHAAAVGRDNRILLLAGPGRAGKSTAALSCALVGWDYAGDDYVFVNTASGSVESLYCSARLRHDMAPAFSDLISNETIISDPDGDRRYELKLARHLSPARIKGGALAAILLPRRTGSVLPCFSPARRLDAVSALYASMTLTQFGWAESLIKKVVDLVGLAPVFFVDTGQAPGAIPEAFAGFLERL
jgi:hypothetical protein